jgi:hypothetical protein
MHHRHVLASNSPLIDLAFAAAGQGLYHRALTLATLWAPELIAN